MKHLGLAAVATAVLSFAASAFAQQISVRPDGRADVVWLDENGYLDYFWAVPGSAWQWGQVDDFQHFIGGQIKKPINEGLATAIAVRSSGEDGSQGEADIAAVDIWGNLYYYYSTEVTFCSLFFHPPGCGPDAPVSWTKSQVAGSGWAKSAPAIAVRPTGEADIVVQGPQNSLQHYHATPGSLWTSDTIAGANTTYSAPSITVLPTGEVAVAALGPNNLLCYLSNTPASTGPSTWTAETVAEPGMIVTPIENAKTTSPGIAARASGEVDVVWYGMGGTVLYFESNLPYSNWHTSTIALGVSDQGLYPSPLIAVKPVDPAGEVDVVVGNVYYYASPGPSNPNPTWAYSWLPSGNRPIGLAVRASNPTGEADVIAVDGNNLTLYYYWTSPPYSYWNSALLLQDLSSN